MKVALWVEFLLCFLCWRVVEGYREVPVAPLLLPERKRPAAQNTSSIASPVDFGDFGVANGYSLFTRQEKECVNLGWIPCPGGNYCSAPGYFCCEGKDFTCPDGTTCCPTGERNCQPEGGVCCGEVSCEAGEQCCPNRDNPSFPCAPLGSICCGDGYCPAGGTCCDGQKTCAKEGHVCCTDGHSCPSESQCCEDDDGPYCADTCLPTIIFPNLEGWSEKIFENMARGIKKSTRSKDGVDVLTWDGGRGRPGRRANAQRRRQAGCGGNLICPPGTNCDEYPFASTIEGGSGATIMCVPIELNDWQGTYWSSWLAEQRALGTLKSGGQFRVKLKFFDIDSVSKRDVQKRDNPVLNNATNVTIISSRAFGNFSNGTNAMIIPLTPDPEYGYLGKYTVDYGITGGALESAYIMDDSGEPYEVMANLPDGSSNTTSFNIDDDGSGNVWLLGWTKSDSAKVNYTVQAPPAPTTSRSASTYVASATGSAASSSSRPTNGATKTCLRKEHAVLGGFAALLLAL